MSFSPRKNNLEADESICFTVEEAADAHQQSIVFSVIELQHHTGNHSDGNANDYSHEEAVPATGDNAPASVVSPLKVGALPPVAPRHAMRTNVTYHQSVHSSAARQSAQPTSEVEYLVEQLLDEQEKSAALALEVTALKAQVHALHAASENQIASFPLDLLLERRKRSAKELEYIGDLIVKARLRGTGTSSTAQDGAAVSPHQLVREGISRLKGLVVNLSTSSAVVNLQTTCVRVESEVSTFHIASSALRHLTHNYIRLPNDANGLTALEVVELECKLKPQWLVEFVGLVLDCVVSFEMHAERTLHAYWQDCEGLIRNERGISDVLMTSLESSKSHQQLQAPVVDATGGRLILAQPSGSRGSSRTRTPTRSVSPRSMYLPPAMNKLQYRPTSVIAGNTARPQGGGGSRDPSPAELVRPGSRSGARATSPATSTSSAARYGTPPYSHSTVVVPSYHQRTADVLPPRGTQRDVVQSAPTMRLPRGSSINNSNTAAASGSKAGGEDANGRGDADDDWDSFVDKEVQHRQGKYTDTDPLIQLPRYSDPADPHHSNAPSVGVLRSRRTARTPKDTNTSAGGGPPQTTTGQTQSRHVGFA